MRIIHVDVSGEPEGIDGLARFVWLLAAEQVRQGNEVTLALRTPVSAAGAEAAAMHHLRLLDAPRQRFGQLDRRLVRFVKDDRPAVVHLHGAWVPSHANLARLCRAWNIVYVYTPHGSLVRVHPRTKRRGVTSKRLQGVYVRFVEGPLIWRAGALAVGVQDELDVCASVAGTLPRCTVVHSSVVDPGLFGQLDRRLPDVTAGARSRCVFLGRFDVFQKGLDRLAELAKLLPEVDFELYGERDPCNAEGLDEVMTSAPPNMHFNAPVYGPAKLDVLASATVYLQYSRFEGSSLSLAEAMAAGLACVISETMAIAREFREGGLGLVLPEDVTEAAGLLREALASPQRLAACGAAARAFVTAHASPKAMANEIAALYACALHQ